MTEHLRAPFDCKPFAVQAHALTERGFPLLVEPEQPAGSIEALLDWIARNRAPLKQSLLQYGAILFRGFTEVDSVAAFERIVDATCPRLLPYIGGTTTRLPLGGKIWSASGARYAGSIPVHQEMSYQETFPSHLMLYCAQPARRGGQTPLASARLFRTALPPEIWDLFVHRGVRTTRRLSPKNARWRTWKGRPWNEALLTENRAEAERIMAGRKWAYRWTRAGGLVIDQPALPATRIHPDTGEEVWFNQAHLNNAFMIRTVLRADRRWLARLATLAMQAITRGRRYPTQTRFADGTAIPLRTLRTVQSCLDASTVQFDWQPSDILIIDNYLVMHGRTRFQGPRVIGAALLTSAFEPDQ